MTKKTEQVQEQQLQLFYDRPLAKGVPNRTFSKNEVLFNVWLKNCIQAEYMANPQINLEHPISIRIDIGEIARRRGMTSKSSIATFKKRMFESAEALIGNSVPAEWIWNVTPEGGRTKKQLPFYSSLETSDQGYITINTSPEFQKYYILKVLQHPELQVNLDFYLQAKSQYSYGLMNLLLAEVAEQRLGVEERIEGEYVIMIPFADVYQKIPPANAKYSPGNYSKNVVEKAVADINANPYSQIHISVTKVKGAYGAIKAFRFTVKLLHPVNGLPTFTTYADEALVDPATGCPSREYLEHRMKQLGVDEPFRKWAWNHRTAMVIACALLHTLANANTPQFFNSVLRAWNPRGKSIFDYASELKANHPELVDNVIESIIPRKQGLPKKEAVLSEEDIQSPELRKYWKKPSKKVQ